MNLKNMRRLRIHLRSRKNRVGFNMSDWFVHNGRSLVSPTAISRAAEGHPCGTVACLAGHAVALALQSGDVPKTRRIDVEDVAGEWLGLDWDEAYDLFQGEWNSEPAPLRDLTKAQAITELTWLIDAEQAA